MTRESVVSWLDSRRPVRPVALAERMTTAVALAPATAFDQPALSATLARVGLWLLADVTGRRTASSGLALDLLAADAFITYAFEAAAMHGEDVGPLATWVMGEAA